MFLNGRLVSLFHLPKQPIELWLAVMDLCFIALILALADSNSSVQESGFILMPSIHSY